jgi:hypothetical protein
MKRIYTNSGKSAPAWYVRSVLALALAPLMLLAFLSVLTREIWRAFKYAWLAVLIEFDAFRRQWNRTTPPTQRTK